MTNTKPINIAILKHLLTLSAGEQDDGKRKRPKWTRKPTTWLPVTDLSWFGGGIPINFPKHLKVPDVINSQNRAKEESDIMALFFGHTHIHTQTLQPHLVRYRNIHR